ncbi:hypothetical protein GYH30_037449 [Glycine max]|nr:hypothetical protein GYH30_037449 [Glycine max]
MVLAHPCCGENKVGESRLLQPPNVREEKVLANSRAYGRIWTGVCCE